MKQSVFGSWNITVIKSEQHLQIELCLEAGDRLFTKTLTKIQKALIGAKYWSIPLKQRVLTSLACTATNSEKLSQIELRPDK